MKKIIKYLIIVVVTLIVQLSTLSIPKTVYNDAELRAVKLGYPVSFVTQNFERYQGLSSVPRKYDFGSPQEDPFRVVWSNFLLSYLVIFFVILLVTPFIEKLYTKIRKK